MSGSLNKDGRRYADRSKSSIISYLMDDNSDSYRRQLELKGIKPKNHHKQNMKHIQQIQRTMKQQQQNNRKRKNKKSVKYSKVDSKLQLKQMLTLSPLSPSSNQANTNFILRNMSNVQSQSSFTKQQRINTQRKPAIPKRSQTHISRNKNVEKKDYISLNKQCQKNINTKNENDDIRFVERTGYGKVPEYIIKRKLEKVELEQKKMEEEELRKIPDGMRKMEDGERLETLDILSNNREEIIDSIRNLPLVIETPSMKRHQSELNKKFNEIEKTIKIFQKTTVFVAMDD